jgi:hypothetical protein
MKPIKLITEREKIHQKIHYIINRRNDLKGWEGYQYRPNN